MDKSNICIWRPDPKNLGVGHVFARQAIQMTWDYAEGNPFSSSSGNYLVSIDWIVRTITLLPSSQGGNVQQLDARSQAVTTDKVVSTDPPYYDNVPYADLADFFYVWLRPSLRQSFRELFATLTTPKAEELVAFAYRHENGKAGAETFFLDGMTQAMHRLADKAHPSFPVTIYYAFKQSESDSNEGTASTGWETFLGAVIDAGFSTSGTWPMRTELGNRTRSMDSNALASSIILVCRPRLPNAPITTRRDFLKTLKRELPDALKKLQHGNIAPVDMAQATIGPGMAIYTRYAKVLESDDRPMPVRTALQLINHALDDYLSE